MYVEGISYHPGDDDPMIHIHKYARDVLTRHSRRKEGGGGGVVMK